MRTPRVLLLPLLLLAACTAVQGLGQAAYWRSCASAPVFEFQQVDILPDTSIPAGGSLQLVMTGESKQPVTAGTATVSVFYWGIRVLTASDTLCTAQPQGPLPTAPAGQQGGGRPVGRLRALQHKSQLQPPASSSSDHQLRLPALQDGATCSMPAGPLQLQHAATLPAIAPKGSYSMRLQAADALTGQELMCVDVWFRVRW